MAPPRNTKSTLPTKQKPLGHASRASSVASASSASGRSDSVDAAYASTPQSTPSSGKPDAKRTRAEAITPSPSETVCEGAVDGTVTMLSLVASMSSRLDVLLSKQDSSNAEMKRIADSQSMLKTNLVEVKTEVEETNHRVATNTTRICAVELELQWLQDGLQRKDRANDVVLRGIPLLFYRFAIVHFVH